MPVKNPVPSMLPVAGALLAHVPLPDSPSSVEDPSQTLRVPDMGAGLGFTVSAAVVLQPVTSKVYVISVVPPEGDTPVADPLEDPMVATAGLALVHVPVPPSVSEVDAPGQTCSVPETGPGAGFTVTMPVTEHPVDGKV